MKLTNKDRAMVVEILRCTADQPRGLIGATIYDAASDLSILHPFTSEVVDLAIHLRVRAKHEMGFTGPSNDQEYDDACLEAAQMVEEGEWP